MNSPENDRPGDPLRTTSAGRIYPITRTVPDQAALFERGTGTHGPAPRPAAGSRKKPPQEQIPANIALSEILAFIDADPGTKNWSAESKEKVAVTMLIGFFKNGLIGMWERPGDVKT